MKNQLRNLFSPLLNIFEHGDSQYAYKPSHRKILIVVGGLFLFLSSISIFATITAGQYAGLLPAVIFLSAGLVCEIVGLLGTDKAVARIWKSK